MPVEFVTDKKEIINSILLSNAIETVSPESIFKKLRSSDPFSIESFRFL